MTSSLSPSPTILVPHLPPKTFVGIDLITFTSTPNFHGIRDLPSGWHFLYTGTTESLSLRSGGWFYVGDITKFDEAQAGSVALTTPSHPGADIIVWKWNTDTETLAPLTIDSDADKQEAMRHKANLGAIWQRGGLFRYRSRVSPAALAQQNAGHPVQLEIDEEDEEEGRQTWKELTDKLTPRLLTRVVGDPALDVDGRPRWMVTSASSAQRDTDVIPGLMDSAEATEELEKVTGEKESEFSFLPIDLKRTWREGAIGRERTEAAQDRSWALGDLIHRVSADAGGDESVGEAQVLGELQLLLLQLKRCDDVEGGLFDLDGEEGGEFLRRLLVKFRRSLHEIVDGTESMVKTEFDKLEAWVKEEYDWELNREVFVRRGMVQLEDGEEVELDMHDDDEDDELGEYAPMVVDLGDNPSQDRVDMGEA
nr:AAR2 domain protein [Aspergillus niger CBS 513.88]|eukprot:XP_001399750.2 AAR2 domain protein [Aspergillus niger CBS 513.88]